LEQLQDVLPRLLSSLSIGRAQIALEQIRSNLQNRPHEEVLFFVARDSGTGDSTQTEPLPTQSQQVCPPLAALIAIHQPSVTSSDSSDVVTIVHAGVLTDHAVDVPEEEVPEEMDHSGVPVPSSKPDENAIIQQMRDHLQQDLKDRGVRFVQWATDAADQVPLHARQWHEGLGFEQIATLDYLAAELSSNDTSKPNASTESGVPIEIQFHPLSWEHTTDLSAFTRLVEATYAGTLDCPKLAEYRTTSETLRGYQAASSFAPELWFEVRDHRKPGNEPIGCVILAKHGSSPPPEDPSPEDPPPEDPPPEDPPSSQSNATGGLDSEQQGKHTTQGQSDPAQTPNGPVIEIVYMGLIPAARGNGLGKTLVTHAVKAALTLGGSRLILGVDRSNQPARDIYRQQGMSEVLSETVWVRQINP